MGKYNHKVTEEEVGKTINQILRANYKFSARFKTKMKFQNLVDLNGKPTPGFIKPQLGDTISVRLPKEKSDFEPEDIPIYPLYEDDDLLIINKQSGITVHPTKGHPTHTIANGIMKYMQDNNQDYKIRFANRIDMDTSGIVIIAKNSNVQGNISMQMQNNLVKKKYLAIVHGVIKKDEFTIDAPIGKPFDDSVARAVLEKGGKNAITDIRVLEKFTNHTLVEVFLHTGRTHQIRVHLSHIGFPIVGDHLYGGEAPELINRQALHAAQIGLKHPLTQKELIVDAPLPEDIKNCLALLKK